MLDILCAGIAASVLSPVFLMVGVAILFESGTPILFSQLRLGQNGRPFRIYKFRKFRPDCDQHGCPLTMEGDGRMTTVGRILAATKLDELPQLWNVLRGDMALVGPRPEFTGLHRLLPQWVREDSRTQARRFWSVSGNVPTRKQALPRRRGCDGFLPAGAVSSQGKDRPGLLPAPYSCFRSRLDSSRRVGNRGVVLDGFRSGRSIK